MGTPNYSNAQLIINIDNTTLYNENYNYDERITKLKEENTMIKSDKKSLENENGSLRINSLKIKNKKLTQENENYLQSRKKNWNTKIKKWILNNY